MRSLNDLEMPRRPRTVSRSRPRMEDSAYLDLYMLQKEKSRLMRELQHMEKRRREITLRLQDIDREMRHLQQVAEDLSEFSPPTSHLSPPFSEQEVTREGWAALSLEY